LSTLFQAGTIERLANHVRDRARPPSWSPLVAIRPEGSRPPLFLAHPAGGSVLCYAGLARHLGLDQPVYGLQAVGLIDGQAPHASIEDMARAYIDALREVAPRGPYLLAGWSLGGIVAFEMARELRRSGHDVGLLALLDTSFSTEILDEAELLVR